VFCVGIYVFVALSGHLPIPYDGDLADYLIRLDRGEKLDLAQLRPDLPDDVILLVSRLLHPQPARRPKNGRRLIDALEAVA
jgi:eukaryotic-like serine/threonine-protein kinase